MKKPNLKARIKAARRWTRATAGAAYVARKAADVANDAAGRACRFAYKANDAARRAALLANNAQEQIEKLEILKQHNDKLKMDARRAAKAARAKIRLHKAARVALLAKKANKPAAKIDRITSPKIPRNLSKKRNKHRSLTAKTRKK